VVLWWGGVWPWLDLDTLLAARANLAGMHVSVVVPTAARPGAGVAVLDRAGLAARMAGHGLAPPQVVALDEWVPYADRHRILNRSAVLAVLHHPGPEAELSFRTRALDGLWAGAPLLLTAGGEVARRAAAEDWGAVVPPNDPEAAATALRGLLARRTLERYRRHLTEVRPRWRWPEVARPLIEALPGLPATGRRGRALAATAAAATLLGWWGEGPDAL
jgi:glycosyltransferase involved in cell wall biosynthesis